jgi:hypothetical protein
MLIPCSKYSGSPNRNDQSKRENAVRVHMMKCNLLAFVCAVFSIISKVGETKKKERRREKKNVVRKEVDMKRGREGVSNAFVDKFWSRGSR